MAADEYPEADVKRHLELGREIDALKDRRKELAKQQPMDHAAYDKADSELSAKQKEYTELGHKIDNHETARHRSGVIF